MSTPLSATEHAMLAIEADKAARAASVARLEIVEDVPWPDSPSTPDLRVVPDSSQRSAQGGAMILPSPDKPLRVARAMQGGWECDGVSSLRRWRGTWMQYSGTAYEEVSDQAIRNELYLRTENAVYLKPAEKQGEFDPVEWNPTTKRVHELVNAMMAVHALDDKVDPGTWVDGSGPNGLISLENTLLCPSTRTQIPHSARYFVMNTLPFNYVPGAQCPRWLGFLESAFPGDQESKNLLQEWFGYVLSGRTSMQKMMFLKGARRSGKGVTSRILTKLLGKDAVAAPTFSSFGTNFGLSTLIGKPLAIIGDARSSNKVDMQAVIERLLSITGEDRMDIDRKNRPVWTGTLDTRMMMLSNEMPWFRDASGAITSRILLLIFKHSFEGKEDRNLEPDLLEELPGILNWALEGLDRIAATRHFTAPVSSEGAMQELADAVSPIGGFIRERCLTGPERQISVEDLFRAWVAWNGEMDNSRSQRTLFGSKLTDALPQVTKKRVRIGGRLEYVYFGVTLNLQP